eukprot:361095-Amphidinium_carterae.1
MTASIGNSFIFRAFILLNRGFAFPGFVSVFLGNNVDYYLAWIVADVSKDDNKDRQVIFVDLVLLGQDALDICERVCVVRLAYS